MKHKIAPEAEQCNANAAVECASPPCLLHELDPDFVDWTAAPPQEPAKNAKPESLAQDRKIG
ncbi:MAG: hypothetical protein B7Z81_06095 [Acidocella sp. 20-61-6]|nr:MAG: hypothetical protein B7Z81_06095 [Acidocella sp. 20-61-6]